MKNATATGDTAIERQQAEKSTSRPLLHRCPDLNWFKLPPFMLPAIHINRPSLDFQTRSGKQQQHGRSHVHTCTCAGTHRVRKPTGRQLRRMYMYTLKLGTPNSRRSLPWWTYIASAVTLWYQAAISGRRYGWFKQSTGRARQLASIEVGTRAGGERWDRVIVHQVGLIVLTR